MPLSTIECCKGRSPEVIQRLINAVHEAQCEAFGVPTNDRQIRYIAHQPEFFATPPDKTDEYTLIQTTLFSGRSVAAKRLYYKAIVSRLDMLGIPADHVFIVLNEQPQENWGIRGGQAACDVDLGFKVDV